MEEITKIKDLRPGMQKACIQGTVVEVTSVEDRLTPDKGEAQKKATFNVQDDTGRVRVVVLGNYCRYIEQEQIAPGRPVKVLYAEKVLQGASGEKELLIHRHLIDIKGLPTLEEEKQQEEWFRRMYNEGVQTPTRRVTRDKYTELYETVRVIIQVPMGMVEFAKTLASRESIPVEELLSRKLLRQFEWELSPPHA